MRPSSRKPLQNCTPYQAFEYHDGMISLARYTIRGLVNLRVAVELRRSGPARIPGLPALVALNRPWQLALTRRSELSGARSDNTTLRADARTFCRTVDQLVHWSPNLRMMSCMKDGQHEK
jgi:hypothetical protein